MTAPPSPGTTIVRGVVHASGASGARSRGDADWTLQLELEPWRDGAGALQAVRLGIRRRVTESELKAYMDRIQPLDVVRLKVRFVEGAARAELIELLGPAEDDEELSRQAALLQQPTTVDDAFFGTLVHDRRLDWYTADTVWAGLPARLHVTPAEDGGLGPALEAAKALWRDQAIWERRLRDYAVQELLDLKNDAWLEDGQAEVTADEFKSRMTLESVTVYADGAFEFFHHDGGLFGGHTIQVCGTLTAGPDRADIPG